MEPSFWAVIIFLVAVIFVIFIGYVVLRSDGYKLNK